MSIEFFVLILVTVSSLASLLYIPKSKYRKALLSFLILQAVTWFLSILSVYNNRFVYPIREFAKATKVGFIPQFLFFPMIFTWFILLYPSSKNIIKKILHYMIFTSLVVWYIYFTCIYTNLRKYTDGIIYIRILMDYLTIGVSFRLCHLYVEWFFNKNIHLKKD
jgi:hypothetical protein